MQYVEKCGDGWWQQGKLLQLSPQMGSKGYTFREGFKKIKLSRAVGTTCPECLRTHRSKGCTGSGGRDKRGSATVSGACRVTKPPCAMEVQ